VLDSPSSNIDGFHLRDTRVSSFQLKRPIWNKMSGSAPKNPDMQAAFLSKSNSILTVKQCSEIDAFLLRDT
jgi:hypothetical protein